jgi:hypothetical protein
MCNKAVEMAFEYAKDVSLGKVYLSTLTCAATIQLDACIPREASHGDIKCFMIIL